MEAIFESVTRPHSRGRSQGTNVGDVELSATASCTTSHLVAIATAAAGLEATTHASAEIAARGWTSKSRFSLAILELWSDIFGLRRVLLVIPLEHKQVDP